MTNEEIDDLMKRCQRGFSGENALVRVPIMRNKYEHNGILVQVDYIRDGRVFFRRWTSGSDGSIQDDWDHFLDAGKMTLADFQRAVSAA